MRNFTIHKGLTMQLYLNEKRNGYDTNNFILRMKIKRTNHLTIQLRKNTDLDEHESLAFPRKAASCHIEEGFPFEFLDL